MPFQALTGAPSLRDGATLNIMPYPQTAGSPVERMSPGARVTLRFGHCCPLVREALIAAVEEEPERVVLIFEGASWILERKSEAVTAPGIVSENWIVRRRSAAGEA